MRFKIILTFLCIPFFAFSQNQYEYRVSLKDKGTTSFDVDHPQFFLSQKAIDRRFKQGIGIDETDLPISDSYISEIKNLGYTIIAKSKWLQTVSINCADTTKIDSLRKLNFVKGVALVWTNNPTIKNGGWRFIANPSNTEYGAAYKQIALNNGTYLHSNGYKGDGMEIAIIDAGYNNLDSIPLFDNTNIMGTKDFVYKGEPLFSGNDHGTKVFSCMASNQSGTYIGTAPDAKYWLLRSEDSRSEYPVEEDYWAAAVEYADSIGVDIVTSSLGYTTFDSPIGNPTQSELNGKTAPISIAAEMATKKGIFVLISAGNEGTNSWGTIAVPADAEDVLTVGSVRQDSTVSDFSSKGPSADLRTKPDVMAMGEQTAVVDKTGSIVYADGTSFATPIMCGMVACLWQANPNLTSKQLLEVVRESAHRYEEPTPSYGYGIPDMKRAMDIATKMSNDSHQSNFVYSSDSIGQLRIVSKYGSNKYYSVRINGINGSLYANEKFAGQITIKLNSTMKAAYIVSIVGKGEKENIKILF